jgi:hypothetical protein
VAWYLQVTQKRYLRFYNVSQQNTAQIRSMMMRHTPLCTHLDGPVPRLVLVALLLLPSTAHLHAQSTNAGITGRVSDPSKAVIDKARVAAINAATNLRYETVTGASGEYSLTNFPAGTYRIEVDKVGFKRLVKPDVELHVQDALEIDFEMTLGAASETVNVEAGAPLVNAE